jgi:hypothetical protein
MSYTVGIPLDGQSLGNSKPQVRANFTQLYNYTAVNHVALNNLGQGKHTFVELVNQANQTTGLGESAIYSQALGPTPFANWVYQQETGGADPLRNQGAIIQMTNIKPVNATVGRSFLPGGLLIVWGNLLSGQTIPAPNGKTTFNWVTANGGEGFTLAGVAAVPFIVLASPNTGALGTGDAWSIDNILTTTFDLRTVGFPTGRTFNYLLIGPKT